MLEPGVGASSYLRRFPGGSLAGGLLGRPLVLTNQVGAVDGLSGLVSLVAECCWRVFVARTFDTPGMVVFLERCAGAFARVHEMMYRDPVFGCDVSVVESFPAVSVAPCPLVLAVVSGLAA